MKVNAYCDGRRTNAPKNKLKAGALCVLLCLASLAEVSEARKVVSGGRITKPTTNRGYANPDIAKLSYSQNQAASVPKPAAAPAPVASAPAQHQPARPVGWNVPSNAPPPYSAYPNHGPPPPYSAQANPNLNSRFNEPPPTYYQGGSGFPQTPTYGGASHPGGFGAPGSPVGAGGSVYRPHGNNISAGGFGGGFAPIPNSAGHAPQGFPGGQPGAAYPGGYQPPVYPQHQPAGFPQQSGVYPQQPGYQPPATGGFQQPATVVHHYEQPSSGGSGVGTVLGAGVAGLAAGVGGAALYDALKPKDSKEEPKETVAAASEATTTTTSTTLAPINPNGDAPLAPLPTNSETPLAPMPADASHPNGETPLAPMPPANPAGEAPLAPMPIVPPNPNGDAPLATMPAETTLAASEPSTMTTTMAALGSAPLAPFPGGDSTSSTGATDSTSPVTSAVAVEAPNAALNVQPNQAAAVGPTTAPQLSAEKVDTGNAAQIQFTSLLLLIPALCKFLLH